jgi:lipopolysaccharide/colanic/teichoic acid biosynthesis glycosyltransferase
LQSDGSPSVGKALDFLRQYFRHVILFPGTDEAPVDGAEVRDLAGVLGIEFTSQLLQRRSQFVKRAIDIVAGSIGIVVAAPIIGLAALAVKMVSRGPAFFSQDRVGLRGRRIRVWKIRTMHVDAEARLERYLASNAEARQEWESRFKLKRDPRIIPGVGSFLRRFSLDELPQLMGVLRGEMSLVGPRPFPDYHLQRFSTAFREFRSQVRPGLTGLWQVLVRSDGGLDEQQALDSHYIRNWSLWLDLYILVRTTLAVLLGKGAR